MLSVYEKYSAFTMVKKDHYLDNLELVQNVLPLAGDVVECGVWRGGMIAGIAEILGKNRTYYLFDSFEGLPEAKEIDGASAIAWQKNTGGEMYFDNCSAEMSFAEKAMKKAGVTFRCIKGWFDQTVPVFNKTNKIALLRLDGDWYDSTMVCLKHLYPKVLKGGIIIIDDYYTWDGCSRAVHDYLSEIKSVSRISSTARGICYIVKMD